MRTITVAERRARLGIRHHLARPATDVERVATDLAGLHSSDPATVHLSARARVRGFESAELEEALYECRSLVRMLGMRRTLFVVALEQAAVMDAACTQALVPVERRRLSGLLGDQGIARDPEPWLDDVRRRTLRALQRRGEAAATELSKDVPELTEKIVVGEGKTWGGQMGVSTRVLFLLAAEGKVVRARPRGGWTSGAYRWATTKAWLGEPLARMPRAEACAALLRTWLRAFGPATTTDVRWWAGWTARLATETLASIDAAEVGLEDGGTGWVLPDDLAPVRRPRPWVALLPSLDPTVMGWKERDWYLGPHGAALFDRNGNAGPTVMADGRVVGGWAQRADGEVVVRVLEDVPSATVKRIDAEAARLRDWLGDVRLKPRFRTPLERELSA